MKRELKRYGTDYAVLAAGGIAGLMLFWFAWPDALLQRKILLTLCGLYPLWGVWHHARRHRANIPIVAEYAAVSVFLATVVWVILDW